jgi:hypothetical protein
VVVESASAMQLAGDNFYKLDDCNHVEVCKPRNQRHPSYSMLLNVLRLCSKGLDPPNPDAPKNIYAFGEGQPTYRGKMVVEPASAMQLAGNYFYNLEDCNHTEVCKPVDKQHPSYSILVDVLRTSRKGTEPEPQEVLRERHAQAAVVRMH